MIRSFFGRATRSSQEPRAETTEVTTDHGLSTVQEDESDDALAKAKAQGSPAYVTNTVLVDEPPKEGRRFFQHEIVGEEDWRNISTPSNSFGSDYDKREVREDGGLLGPTSFQTQGAASWSTQYEFPSYQGQIPPPFPLPSLPGPLPSDPGLGGLGDPVSLSAKDFPSWMTEDNWPSYSDKDAGAYPMMMPPFPMAPPGTDSQSLAQYSARLQALADSYSRQATMVASMATAEGDLGLGMMPGMPGMAPKPGMPGMGLNPWVLPDASGYGQKGGDRPRTRTDSVQSTMNEPPLVVKSESEWVTVMIRNLPNNYGRDDVVALLDEQGFSAKYDFVYLPIDFKNSSGLGYAFVNMVCHDDALELKEKLEGFKDWKVTSQKVCEVAWGNPEQQGLDFHISRYRNSPVMHNSVKEEFKPLIFQNGKPVPFPEPTKAPRRPRMKKHARIGCRSPEGSDREEEAEPADRGS